MGIVVFGTYDLIVDGWKRRHSFLYQHNEGSYDHSYETFVKRNQLLDSPIVMHSVAGLVAGVARSLFWMAWEASVHQSNWVWQHPKFCQRTVVHHALGYGALFGSYHATRQALVSLDPFSRLQIPDLSQSAASRADDNHSERQRTWQPSDAAGDTAVVGVSLTPVAYTVLAGGVAGQTHHLINHYTSHWKQFRSTIPLQPRFRPAMISFGTMSLCFTAFEHGSDCVGYVMECIDETLDRL